MKTAEDFIREIKIEKSNLEYIAKTGEINGSLLLSFKQAMRLYAEQAIDRCAEVTGDLKHTFCTEKILDVKNELK